MEQLKYSNPVYNNLDLSSWITTHAHIHTHTHTPNHTHKYTTSRRTALFSQGTVAFFTEMKCWELINSGAELELNSMTPCLTCVTQWFFLHIMTSIYIYRYCSLMTRLFILLLQNKSIITRQHLLTMKNPRAMYKGPQNINIRLDKHLEAYTRHIWVMCRQWKEPLLLYRNT